MSSKEKRKGNLMKMLKSGSRTWTELKEETSYSEPTLSRYLKELRENNRVIKYLDEEDDVIKYKIGTLLEEDMEEFIKEYNEGFEELIRIFEDNRAFNHGINEDNTVSILNAIYNSDKLEGSSKTEDPADIIDVMTLFSILSVYRSDLNLHSFNIDIKVDREEP